jgi:hypothetical protein
MRHRHADGARPNRGVVHDEAGHEVLIFAGRHPVLQGRAESARAVQSDSQDGGCRFKASPEPRGKSFSQAARSSRTLARLGASVCQKF